MQHPHLCILAQATRTQSARASSTEPTIRTDTPWLAAPLAIAAATAPSLLAYNLSPSPTFLNQALAFMLWGAFIAVAAWPGGGAAQPQRAAQAALATLAILALAALWSWAPGGLPASLALSSLATLAAAALALLSGAAARGTAGTRLFAAFCTAWVAAGLFNTTIALIQVFLPGLPDGDWIAASGIVGRAVGNLRQPNHLSSLLLWSCIAVAALAQLRQLGIRAALVLMALFVFAVVLTASRTGLLSVLLLGLWGLADRRLARPVRGLLLAAPLLYALAWWGLAQWAELSRHSFGGTARLAETDISGSRFGIWANTLALIKAHPWFGVGWGEFNLAWTMTPFPGRPVAFFDHTHNLPLQLAVEIGLPLAALVIALLLFAFGSAGLAAWRERTDDDAAAAQRAALMMVLMIGLHSLLEYPLWYSYFLLPAAWAFGFALRGPGGGVAGAAASRPRGLVVGGWLLVAGTVVSLWDYARVADIYQAAPGAAPLAQRIERGQRSVFFAHHADYAAVTSGVSTPHDPARAFDRVSHYLLDTRLMIAWAKSLAAQGDLDAARHIAARLREFRKPDAEAFFEPCPDAAVPPGGGAPFQCELPPPLPWQRFLPRP
jgi:Virulence factor membrane-bound polymerase, C-terminal/O-Antigen ligase/Protein glycosylation ligase